MVVVGAIVPESATPTVTNSAVLVKYGETRWRLPAQRGARPQVNRRRPPASSSPSRSAAYFRPNLKNLEIKRSSGELLRYMEPLRRRVSSRGRKSAAKGSSASRIHSRSRAQSIIMDGVVEPYRCVASRRARRGAAEDDASATHEFRMRQEEVRWRPRSQRTGARQRLQLEIMRPADAAKARKAGTVS